MPSPVQIFLTEASLGCLMAVLSTADAAPIIEWAHENIDPTKLADDGYEACPHVTVAFGLAPGVDVSAIQKAIAGVGRVNVKFTLGNIKRFTDNPAYDVVVVELSYEDELVELHDSVATAFKLEETYDYHPHLTLAYTQKGACAKLDGHAKFAGNTYVLRNLVYSVPGSTTKYPVALDRIRSHE